MERQLFSMKIVLCDLMQHLFITFKNLYGCGDMDTAGSGGNDPFNSFVSLNLLSLKEICDTLSAF